MTRKIFVLTTNSNHANMVTAVVLAGGKGTRLRPFTLHRPKPLMPVVNKPLIDYVLDMLELSGVVGRVYVLCDYMGDALARYLRNSKRGTEVIPLTYKSLDTADAVRRVRSVIDGDFLVVMGDIVTNCDLGLMWETFQKKRGMAMVALKDVDTPNHYGVTVVASDDRIVGFLEKPSSFELYLASIAVKSIKCKYYHSNLANAGIYALSYSVLDVLDDNPHLLDFGRHVFPYLLEEGYSIYGWYMGPYYWIDVGLPNTYLKANMDLLDNRAIPLKPRGSYSGGVWFSSHCMIHGLVLPPAAIGEIEAIGGEVVFGPYAVLGDGVSVREKAKVANSVLMESVRVGKGSSIENSVIGADAEIGDGAAVKYSIVEDGAVIPDGAKVFGKVVLAGLREENSVTMIELGARI